MEKEKRISTREMEGKINNAAVKIIDVRSADSYNGWKDKKEKRGGHIENAKSIPFKWFSYIDWIDIINGKGITSNDEIVVCGDNMDETDRAAARFKSGGFDKISVYYDFINEWAADESKPMQRLAKYEKLVPSAWLKKLIDTGAAAKYGNDKFVVCHAHYRNKEDYKKGHIPGAVEIDTNTLESPETWNRRQADEIENTLKTHGIDSETTVILYGRFSYPGNDDPFPGSSAGHLAAMRCAFIMLYAGVKDVRILNGGMQSWEDMGYEVSVENVEKKPVDDFREDIPAHPEFAVDTPEAKEIIRSGDKNLVSVRSYAEYTGKVSGYNYITKKGRIPGAIFGNCGSDAYHMENYRNLDHTTREYGEIENMWKEAGITPDKHNAFYCGTGWRASEAFFNAYLMGWPRISVYDGGWFEWSNDPKNPVSVKETD